MKIAVLYDHQGKIIAAIQRGAGLVADAPSGFFPREGQKAAELEVPEDVANRDFVEMCKRMQVDLSGKRPYLKSTT